MTKIFSQKIFYNDKETILECFIDDNDKIHFTTGIIDGQSNMETFVNPDNELVLDFPIFREMVTERFKGNIKGYNLTQMVKIENEEKEFSINKKFLLESFSILEKMWEDED
jgi:hypothetical protein